LVIPAPVATTFKPLFPNKRIDLLLVESQWQLVYQRPKYLVTAEQGAAPLTTTLKFAASAVVIFVKDNDEVAQK
jgi:hypothetical protein